MIRVKRDEMNERVMMLRTERGQMFPVQDVLELDLKHRSNCSVDEMVHC